MKKSEKFIVGVIMVVFIIFLALFSIYESNITGEGQQNFSDTNDHLYFTANANIIFQHPDAVDMANIALTMVEYPEIKQQ